MKIAFQPIVIIKIMILLFFGYFYLLFLLF